MPIDQRGARCPVWNRHVERNQPAGPVLSAPKNHGGHRNDIVALPAKYHEFVARTGGLRCRTELRS